ncbi:A/G-specific adenine glycosylase [Lacticaseibacillus suihuaensis]
MNWSQAKIHDFRQTLLAWYDREGRDLPWRQDHEPYHVLLSETMLQQTQVQTVIPYYLNFIAQFPTVAALAQAPEAAVLKAWEGLGYYSRARNLQKAAQQVAIDRNGAWPTTAAELRQLQGVGPYTAGAVASIAFGEVTPAVDGNAFRVFARLFCVPDDITKPKTRQVFETLIQQVIDPERPGDFNQAIMDLGASYMTAKDSDPAHSPVARFDESLKTNRVQDFPVRTPKARPRPIDYYALAVRSPAGWLMQQRPAKGMLARLWLFPLVEVAALPEATPEAAAAWFAAQTGQSVRLAPAPCPVVTHTFTHQKWQMTLLAADTAAFDPAGAAWVADFDSKALPTVQKKLLSALSKAGWLA